jgi:hypothetical protein
MFAAHIFSKPPRNAKHLYAKNFRILPFFHAGSIAGLDEEGTKARLAEKDTPWLPTSYRLSSWLQSCP